MTRVAVLVSGGGTNLQALIDSAPYESGELALVVSSKPDAFALERAKKAGIPTAVADIKAYPDRERYTEALISILDANNIDLVVFAGFMYILSPSFSEKYENRAMNVHPALIPAFCGEGFYGLRVHERVLEKGVKVTGATVHFVSEVCDGGPIIFQKAVPVLDNDTPKSIQRRVMEQAEWDILPKAVRFFCAGRLKVENGIVKLR